MPQSNEYNKDMLNHFLPKLSIFKYTGNHEDVINALGIKNELERSEKSWKDPLGLNNDGKR